MSDLTTLPAKLKALPFLETPLARKGEIDYSALDLKKSDVLILAEIADLLSSIFENMADPDDDLELSDLISASFHACAALASLKNPEHFPYFHRFLLKAVKAIADIEAINNEGLLDHSLHGNLEEIEIALGLRTERSSLIPSDEPMNPRHSLSLRKEELAPLPERDSSPEVIDHYLALYQSSGSIADHVELAGYLAATAIVTPRLDLRRVSQIAWSGKKYKKCCL